MLDASYAYYPGCSGSGTSMEYDKSTRAVCAALGVNLVDIPDWNCCGSSPAHTVDASLSAALSARNLAQAETVGLSNTLTPCPSCLKNLHNAVEHMKDPAFKASVDELTERPLQKEHTVKSVLQVIYEDVTPEGLAAKVKRPLTGLKLAPYYGCLMTRPGKSMHFDDEENPVSIDRLMEALGAEIVPFPLKVDCCGASFGIPRADVVAQLSGRILESADSFGADAMVAACPLCQMNLDMRQGQVNSRNKLSLNLPVFYYTQLIGLALGLEEKALALDKLIVNPAPALAKIGTESAKPAKPAKAPAKPKPAKAGSTKKDPGGSEAPQSTLGETDNADIKKENTKAAEVAKA